MTTLSDLQAELAALPPNLRDEVGDFLQSVKQRHGLPTAPAVAASTTATGDSTLYEALEATGFIGCIDTGEQLSTTYKNQLDFSPKCRTQP